MRFISLIFFLLIVVDAHAGFFLGIHGGVSKDHEDKEESSLSGSMLGLRSGLRIRWFALELGQSFYALKTPDQELSGSKVEESVLAKSLDLGARIYLTKFFSFFGGASWTDSEYTLKLTSPSGGSGEAKIKEIFDNGSYYGAGLHLPINYNWEIHLEFVQRVWKFDDKFETDEKFKLDDWRLGITYYFGSSGASRKSDSSKSADFF